MYFKNFNSIDDLRQQYKALCVRLHPDKPNGNHKLFVEMQEEYQKHLEHLTSKSESFNYTEEKELQDRIDSLMNLDGLIIELCGTWLWITGNTIEHKGSLKSLGFKWASKKKKWYFSPYKTKRKGKRTMSMGYIRNKYGSKTIVNENKKIAA